MRFKSGSGIMIMLFLASMLTMWVQPIAAQPSGMVSYWRLNEDSGTTAYDSVGANHGTLINGPTWTTGQVDGALSFDGVDDYVDCGDIAELNSASAFTVLGWYKDDYIAGHNRLFDKNIDGYLWDISGATYNNRLYIEVGNGANTYAYWTGYSSVVSAGVWYHAAFVFDGSGATNADRAKIYVNGVERSLTFSGSMPSSTADLTGYPFTISKAVNHWNGDIDEVAIYNRALTPEEIQQHYENGLMGLGYCMLPVGGVWLPINKFELLAPWIGLASFLIVSAAAVSVVYVKHRKKQQT